MQDPYAILGLARAAKPGEIKAAYRKLAKQYHPDNNQGDEGAARKFAEISQAYELLSNNGKRQRFDRGEIDARGNPRFRGFNPLDGKGFARSAFRARKDGSDAAGPSGFTPDDLFTDIIHGLRNTARRHTSSAGNDLHGKVTIPFSDAASGARRRIKLPNNKTLEVTIPAGVNDGQQVRLKGQGEPGTGGGAAGDALITVHVTEHPLFEREGRDLRLELPVTLYEAILGAKVRVPTLDGSVELKVPAGSSSGRTLRLKGKGIRTDGKTPGDLLITIKIMLPERSDRELTDLMTRWREQSPYSVRGERFRNI